MIELKNAPKSVSFTSLVTLIVIFFLAVSTLFWVIHHHRFRDQQRHLKQAGRDAQASLERHLQADQDYLQLLAEQMADGSLNKTSFQDRVTQYVAKHPELVNVTWADDEFIIRWTAPYEPNKEVVGLKLLLPEPKRAFQLAYETKMPVYTQPFVIIQGQTAFEVYVPVFRGTEFLGTFGGIYAVDNVLQHTLPPTLSQRYQVSLFNSANRLLAQSSHHRFIDPALVISLSIEPPGNGLKLRLARYQDQGRWLVNGLGLMIGGLMLGLGWMGWRYQHASVERAKSETALKEREDYLGKWQDLFRESGWRTATIYSMDEPASELPETPAYASRAISADDELRLQALSDSDLLDTPPEQAFDRLTELACRLLRVPVSLISLVDTERQFFKSSQGLFEPWHSMRETPLSHSFCQHVVTTKAALVVNDARSHPLVVNNLAIHDLGVIAYLGVPLEAPNGQVLGSFCAISDKPRTWTATDLMILQDLAAPAMTEIAARQQLREREHVEQALRESEERLSLVVRSTNTGVWDYDLVAGRMWWNDRYDELFGPRPVNTAASWQWWIDRIHPDERQHILDMVQRALDHNDESWQGEYRFRLGDNSYVHVMDRAYISRDATGQATRILGTMLDITERHRVEEQLRQAQKMEALGTLAGGIAHEFNNILAVIFGFAELGIYKLPHPHPVSDHLREMLKTGKRARELIQQILTFSRKSNFASEPTRLAALVAEALGLIRPSLPSTIIIEPYIAADAGAILADPSQIHQVLINLCTNAEYAMRQRGGVLEIRVDNIEVDAAFADLHPPCRPGPHVRLAIRDSGTGMVPEVAERVFEPFFTTKEVGEGSGMGLSIVHGIVTSHQGVITVESLVGEGTTFTLYFPRVSEPVLSITDAPDDIPHGVGRLLLVDDEAQLTRLLQQLLMRIGYDVKAYTSALEALAAFEAEPNQFDLVITDQTMPHLTGEQLVQAIRQIRPNIPMILCTGFSHTMNAEKAHALGIDFCLKPFNLQQLADMIQRVLSRRAEG